MTKVINRSKPGSCVKHLSSNRIQEILMILPMTIGFLLFSVYPIIWVIRWSCFNYNGFSTPVWCGLDNFIRVLTRDPAYWNSLLNTFIIAGLKMLVEIPMALILACWSTMHAFAAASFSALFSSCHPCLVLRSSG